MLDYRIIPPLLGIILLGLGCQQHLERPTVSFGKEAFAVCVTATPQAIAISAEIENRGLTDTTSNDEPYYKVEQFGKGDLVHLDGTTLKLISWEETPSDVAELSWHRFQFEVTNHTVDGVLVPLSKLLFVRRVVTLDGEVKEGRWAGSVAPDQISEELRPLGLRERRLYTVSVLAPAGNVPEVGLLTEWRDGLAGGVPIWFLPKVDVRGCRYGWADVVNGDAPPRPTPYIIGYGSGRRVTDVGACVRPLRGPLVRGFGCSGRQTGIDQPRGCSGQTPYFHNGWDVDGAAGDSVVAPITGVIESGFNEKLGIFVRVIGAQEQHDLLHLSSAFVGNGQEVEAGEVIGEVGNTGNSEGAHLHWTIQIDGVVVDPAGWSCMQGEE